MVLRVDQHQQPTGCCCGGAGDRGKGCHGCLRLGWGNQPMRRKSQRLSVLMLDGWYWLLPKFQWGGLASRASQSLLRLLSRSSANRHSRKDLRWLESWPGGLLPARSVNPWITASMAKVIPLFPGRPPGGLDRSEQLDDLRCRLADQEAAIKALNDQLHELVFCLLTREPA